MNYEDYLDEANRYFVKHQDHLRYGQALMNYLFDYAPTVYSEVIFEGFVDPFYDDAIVPEFLNFVSNKFYQLNHNDF